MRPDSLGRIAGDLIGYVQFFRDAHDSARPSANDLRSQILQMLDRISNSPTGLSLDAIELDAARFALAAWADETILMSTWAERNEWHRELLQSSLYGTNKGGDEFYDRLSALPVAYNEAREIYFLCLVNGFEGRLVGNDSARHELTRQLYETLRLSGHALDLSTQGHLAEPAYNLAIEVHGGGDRKLLPIVATFALATTVGCALFYLALWLLAGSVELPREY